MKQYKLSNHEIIIHTDKNTDYKKNNDLLNSLKKCKCKIDHINLKKWGISKKSHNIYEYIYTSSNTNKNVCSVLPVSRSYFKLLEILYEFNIFSDNKFFSCIAEGPGGFIQCLHDTFTINNYIINKINCITLISCDKKIPNWNNLILSNPKNNIQYGLSNNGDIYQLNNCLDYINNHKEKCFLVTSDGGFDFSDNYNEQELNSIKLLYSEIFITLHVQDLNGHFVIKMFDLLDIKTIQLLYILYIHYEEIIFYKPDTSRLSNSEKYVVCNGFKGVNNVITEYMKEKFTNINDFKLFVPDSFIKEINEFNKKFIENQIKNINEVITLSNNKYIKNYPSNLQIDIAKKWCKKYKLNINESYEY